VEHASVTPPARPSLKVMHSGNEQERKCQRQPICAPNPEQEMRDHFSCLALWQRLTAD